MATNSTDQPVIHGTPDWEAPSNDGKKGGFLSKYNLFNVRQTAPASSEKSALETSTDGGPVYPKRSFSERFVPIWARRNKKASIGAFVALILLILVLGLGLGLGLKKKKSKDLPLPTNTGIFTGDLTYYSPGPGYGACGFENTSSDSICAVSHIVWDAASTSSNPNANPLCGKKIRITRAKESGSGNNSVDVEVVDRCVGCAATDLDLSLSVFDQLAEEDEGRVVGSWAWLD